MLKLVIPVLIMPAEDEVLSVVGAVAVVWTRDDMMGQLRPH